MRSAKPPSGLALSALTARFCVASVRIGSMVAYVPYMDGSGAERGMLLLGLSGIYDEPKAAKRGDRCNWRL
jgi:hypothetical protein